MKLNTGNTLLLPALSYLSAVPSATTRDIERHLRETVYLTAQDKKKMFNRKHDRFAQTVMNMVSHRKFKTATAHLHLPGQKHFIHIITKEGRKILRNEHKEMLKNMKG